MTQHSHLTASTGLDYERTLILAVEVSGRSWVVAAQVPGLRQKGVKQQLAPRADALMAAVEGYKRRAAAAGMAVDRVIVAYESGGSGFWLARWLQQRGVEVYVMQPSSVPVDRRMRRAKSDRIDADMLLRTLLAWLRREPRVCSMVPVPDEATEDARRPMREREELIRARVAIVNRIEAVLTVLGPPDPGLDHPAAQRLARDPHIVAVRELLGSQGWAEIRIMLAHQGDGLVAQDIRQAIVGGPAATAICDRSRTALSKAAHQTIDLTLTDPQQRRGGPWGETAALKAGQNIDPVEVSFAHQHHAHQICRLRPLIPKGRRLTV